MNLMDLMIRIPPETPDPEMYLVRELKREMAEAGMQVKPKDGFQYRIVISEVNPDEDLTAAARKGFYGK